MEMAADSMHRDGPAPPASDSAAGGKHTVASCSAHYTKCFYSGPPQAHRITAHPYVPSSSMPQNVLNSRLPAISSLPPVLRSAPKHCSLLNPRACSRPSFSSQPAGKAAAPLPAAVAGPGAGAGAGAATWEEGATGVSAAGAAPSGAEPWRAGQPRAGSPLDPPAN